MDDLYLNCFVCEHVEKGKEINARIDADMYQCDCPRCGRFKCSTYSRLELLQLAPGDRRRLSGAIRERFDREPQTEIVLKPELFVPMLSGAPEMFDVPGKASKFLNAISRRIVHPAHACALQGPVRFALSYSANVDDYTYLLEFMKARNWISIQRSQSKDTLVITPEGWEVLRHRPRIESTKAFAAMSFVEVMKATYMEAIEPAVRDDAGFECRRIDAKEYNGGVVDEIKAEIRESRFVVADVTNHRNGVYFEAGFADGLGIPVIWTCTEADADNTHFDTKHLNQIRWTSHDDLRKRLSDRIKGTIGRGPLKPREKNP